LLVRDLLRQALDRQVFERPRRRAAQAPEQ
jgi:hypothetical protein